MRPGDVVQVKVKETGEKVTAVVTEIHTDADPIDVTESGLFGGPAATFRTRVPGQYRTTLALVVTEP